MGLFIYAQLKIHDRARYNAYMEAATPMFMEHGVKIHAATENMRFHGGDQDVDKIVLMEFRDPEHMQGFMSNPAYVEAAKDRDAGANLTSVMFEGLEWPPQG